MSESDTNINWNWKKFEIAFQVKQDCVQIFHTTEQGDLTLFKTMNIFGQI
jgi:hypothetical protein